MKKIFVFSMIILCGFIHMANGKNKVIKNVYAQVKGRVEMDDIKEVGLYQVMNGRTELIARTNLGKDGFYGFDFAPHQAGYYMVGPKNEYLQKRVYLQAGDQAEINFLNDTIVFAGKSTPENRWLAEWESRIELMRRRIYWGGPYRTFNYTKFFPYLETFVQEAKQFKTKINSGNKEFDDLLKQTVDFDLDYYALEFLQAYRADESGEYIFPELKDCSSYYETVISDSKMSDNNILSQFYGADFLIRYTDFAMKKKGLKSTIDNKLTVLSSPELKATFIIKTAERASNYARYVDIREKYANYFTSEAHIRLLDKISAEKFEGIKGELAAGFTYPDKNGKMISLTDFKGKAVVIDVWASWCGPCRGEMPYLKKIEKEFEGKEVEFIGISLDVEKNYGKWLKAMEEEKLEGIQLFANGMSKITKDYKITGIPHFIVVDRKGMIVSADAPKPSSRKLQAVIEEALKQ